MLSNNDLKNTYFEIVYLRNALFGRSRQKTVGYIFLIGVWSVSGVLILYFLLKYPTFADFLFL